MAYLVKYQTVIGQLGIVDDGGCITRLYLPTDPCDTACFTDLETALLAQAYTQLQEYLTGERWAFTLPLALKGTPFLRRVWDMLSTIPYGQTATYAQVANLVGNPKAYRAVGMANHINPIPIIVPCHRVVGARGELTGYRGGLELKSYLLELEKRSAQLECTR